MTTTEEMWYTSLDNLKTYIDDNGKIPSRWNEDWDISRLGIWFRIQRRHYKAETHIMGGPDERVYNTWREFIDDVRYRQYFERRKGRIFK